MITQEILDSFVYETLAGSFVAIDPTEHDAIIGYHSTKEEAIEAFKQYVDKEGIIWLGIWGKGIQSINRKNNSLKFYEFGKTYHKYNDKYQEDKHLTLFVTGKRTKESWNTLTSTSDFFYVKGVLTSVLDRLGIQNLKTTPTKNDIFSEGITLSLGKIKLVDFGVVKRSILKEFGIKQEVLFADFNWENVLKLSSKKNIKVSDLSKFPSVKRDLALLIDNKTEFKEVYNLAFQSERKLLKDVDLFDVYEGDKLPEGKQKMYNFQRRSKVFFKSL